MHLDFKDRTVVITGAAQGFGRALTARFVTEGAHVFACDINDAGLERTKELTGGVCETGHVDVADRDAFGQFVSRAEQTSDHGAVDILINNAGGVLGQVGRPIEEITQTEWQIIFDVNVSGAFYGAQAVAPGMKRRRTGRIVNISSGAGLGVSLTGIQAYASAKAAQIGLTRQLAQELGPWGITVNSVAPGFVRSNPTTERQWEALGPEGQRQLIDGLKLKRPGSANDIVNAVQFLASDQAGWITAQILGVDGGR